MEDLVFGRRYRALEKIGTGGMADVYKAVDEVLGRTVAVKVMHPRYASDPSFATRFRQEAQAAANLQSPNIVNMYDWGADGDTYYIVMEYVRGSDLKSIITQKGALASAKVADIGAQVCSALSVAHGYDIIHRDIKPHNLMVQPDGSVKVMDFGIARAGNTTMTQTGSVLGTAHYVSPEQAQGKELHATSDLYSLGIVLYEAATGHLPFDADTPVAIALKQVNEQPMPPRSVNPNVDPGLEAIIVKAMQKNPSARYASADEMRRDLRAVSEGQAPAGAAVAAAGVAGAVASNAPAQHTAVLPQVGQAGVPGAYSGAQNRRQPPPPKKHAVWPWVLVVVALALAGLGVAWASGHLTPVKPEPQTISVPDVTNLSQAQATDQLRRDGFVVASRVTYEYSALAEGNVTSQTPPPHSEQPKLTRVSLVISKGPQPVAVPDILGKTEAEAIAILGDAGFKASAAPSVFSKAVKKGNVASQTPAPLTQQPPGTTIMYTVSMGPKKIEVPDVTGKSQYGATTALKSAGFRVNVVPDFSDTVAKGYVSDQDLTAGGLYPPKAIVTITVSKGAGVLVPNTVANTWADAKTLLSKYGLVIDPASPSADPSATVQSQDPTAGTRVDKSTTVHLTF